SPIPRRSRHCPPQHATHVSLATSARRKIYIGLPLDRGGLMFTPSHVNVRADSQRMIIENIPRSKYPRSADVSAPRSIEPLHRAHVRAHGGVDGSRRVCAVIRLSRSVTASCPRIGQTTPHDIDRA